jgi:hypothetical protein
LERVAASAPTGTLRIRLHPRERDIVDELGLGPATVAALSDARSLADDLADVDGLVAPFSTVLLEGAAAGRRVVSVVPEPACVPVRSLSPAMADPALRVLTADEVTDHAALCGMLERDGGVTDWGRRFAQLDPEAPTRCATALLERARMSRTS